MNDFDRKREAAIALVARKGIMKGDHSPLGFLILWRLGIELPPPHFLSFTTLTLVSGLPFGIFWIGVCMMSFDRGGFDPLTAVIGFCTIVLIPGAAIATYYRIGRKRFRLPCWSDL